MYLEFLKDFTLRALEAEERQRVRDDPMEIPADDDIETEGQVQKVKELPIEEVVFKDLKAALQMPDILNNMNVYGLPKLWSIT